jgi:hypothetical protein
MPRKRQAKAQRVQDTRTPEDIAEERIAEWKRQEEIGRVRLETLG